MKYKPDINVIKHFSEIDFSHSLLEIEDAKRMFENIDDDRYTKLSDKGKIDFLEEITTKVNDKYITPNAFDYPTYIWGKYAGTDIYDRLNNDNIMHEENDIIIYSLLKYYLETNNQPRARAQLNKLLKKIDKNPDEAYLIEFCKTYHYDDFNCIQYLEDCHDKFPNNRVIIHILALNYMHELNINKIEHYLCLIFENPKFQIEFTDYLYWELRDVIIERLERRLDYTNIFKVISIIESYNFQFYLDSELSLVQSSYHEKYRKNSVANAKSEERDKIISSLSHSIKNIIASVIDPLKNLQKEEKYRPKIIKDAIRGTQLIREMVTAINYSYKGSIEDFYSDVENAIDSDSITIKQMISV
jgi:hypothetical protein